MSRKSSYNELYQRALAQGYNETEADRLARRTLSLHRATSAQLELGDTAAERKSAPQIGVDSDDWGGF